MEIFRLYKGDEYCNKITLLYVEETDKRPHETTHMQMRLGVFDAVLNRERTFLRKEEIYFKIKGLRLINIFKGFSCILEDIWECVKYTRFFFWIPAWEFLKRF